MPSRCRVRLKPGAAGKTGIRCHLPKGHGTRANNDARKVQNVIDTMTGLPKPIPVEHQKTHQARSFVGKKPHRHLVMTRWNS